MHAQKDLNPPSKTTKRGQSRTTGRPTSDSNDTLNVGDTPQDHCGNKVEITVGASKITMDA